jgi:hypothetical protein
MSMILHKLIFSLSGDEKIASADSMNHSDTYASFSAGDKKFKVLLGLSFNVFAIRYSSIGV